MLSVGLILLVIPAVLLAQKLLVRPQRGILLLALVAPYDGLLLLLDGTDLLEGWKEALVAVTLAATFFCPSKARAVNPGVVPAWVGPLIGLIVVGLVSTAWVSTPVAIAGLKVDFYYLLVPWAIWRCPLSAKERDQLVTILMLGGFITASIGVAQQFIGPEELNALGYEFNTVIRTTGSVLRSFSTFELPFPFAFYMVFVLAIGIPVAFSDPTRLRNRLFLLSTPLLVAGILAAVVRAAVLAVFIAGLYHVARRYREVLSVTPLGLLLLALAPATLLSAVLSSSSLNERVDGWSLVSDTVISRPLGTGIGTVGSAAEVATDLGGGIEESFGLTPDLLPYQPDNYYVKRVLELGPIGLWLTIVLLRHAIETARSVRTRAGPADEALIDGIVASILGSAAAATVATYFEIFPLDLFFWMMLGVLTSIDRAESASPDSPSSPVEVAFKPISTSS
ncbi:MAG: O-antigen ligase family protein [Acidimicrobiales bacterium]